MPPRKRKSPSLIWFLLVDAATGQPYKGTTPSAVSLPPESFIVQFRKAVKAEYADSHLQGVAPSDLLVYKNKEAFDKRNAEEGKAETLDEESPVADLGRSKAEALYVAVPSPIFWSVATAVSTLEYDNSSDFFELDQAYLAKTGLPDTQKVVLYCRPIFHQQFKFLQDDIAKDGGVGWILGPPGTGKSTTTLAFASTLDRNQWVVTWIHLSRTEPPICIRLDRNSKKTCKIRNMEDLDLILNQVDNSVKHYVFLDGFCFGVEEHCILQKGCYFWLKLNEELMKFRRLVIICSMSARSKVKLEEDKASNVKEFFVYSWKMEEYLSAIQQDSFFNSVISKLDSCIDILGIEERADLTPSEIRADLIKSKYFFAGGCARYMFLFSTDEVIELLTRSIATVGNYVAYISGQIGDQSDGVINRLFSRYQKKDMQYLHDTCIVSEWAASELAMKSGPELVKSFASATRSQQNPSLDGWLFEMWFFALLRHCGIELLDKFGNKTGKWPASNVFMFNPMSSIPDLSYDNGVWLKPTKWNQGGYDAVYVDSGKSLVRFVQVTRGVSHSFNIPYFSKFLEMLRDSRASFEVKNLAIVFLVLQENVESFTLPQSAVIGPGLLAAFGWEKGKEHEKADILGIQYLN